MPPPQERSDFNLIDQKVSDRKIEANRENAKKSTGPRTIDWQVVNVAQCDENMAC